MAFTELLESSHRVAFSSTVLMDFGSWMVGEFQLVDGHGVQVAQYVGFDSIKTFDRGNVEHTMSFTVIREHASPADAKGFCLLHAKALQAVKRGQDCTLAVHGWLGTMTLKNASLMSSPSTTYERFSQFSYTIMGGKLDGNLSNYNPDAILGTEGGDGLGTEGGDGIGLES